MILLTRAVNIDGKQEHKLPCSPAAVINFITEVKGFNLLAGKKAIFPSTLNPLIDSFHESFPDEIGRALSMKAEQAK